MWLGAVSSQWCTRTCGLVAGRWSAAASPYLGSASLFPFAVAWKAAPWLLEQRTTHTTAPGRPHGPGSAPSLSRRLVLVASP
uniref:Uncharacterized protein n=1 Tax=Arundo donax TaxID=35708 RepID=A0A0A9HC32_ARUDO